MNTENKWEHQRSSLTHLMLMSGFNYIMCEVADEDRDFEWCDSFEIVIITGCKFYHDFDTLLFTDIEGNEHSAAQPINFDGTVMAYHQYLKLK